MRNQQALIFIFIANTISGLATGITVLAIPWYFSDILQKPSLFGWAYAGITFISLFWSTYAGTLIDKYSRKLIYQFSTLSSALVVGSVAFYGFYYGQVPAGLVILAFATTFLNFNIHYPNLYALGQEITEKHYYGKLNSYLEIQGQSTNTIAGALAAVLLSGTVGSGAISLPVELPFEVEAWSIQEVLFLDGATYFLSFILISMIRYQPLVKRQPSTGSIIDRIGTGFKYLKNRPNIFLFGLFSNAIFITVLVHAFFLLPRYINDHLHAQADLYGAAEMLFAFGAIGSGIAIRKIYQRQHPVVGVVVNTAFGAGLLLWFALTNNIYVLLIGSIIYGLANSGNRILRMTYFFNVLPNDVIGRANSVINVVLTVLRIFFIGIFSLPFFAVGNNVIFAYGVLSIYVLIAFGVLIYIYPALKRWSLEPEGAAS